MLRKSAIIELFRRFQAKAPNPTTELVFKNPYTLLVAVVLSAQATDKSVNAATAGLFTVVDTPEAMVALGEERLTEYARKIGLYRAKVKNVIGLSRRLIAEFGARVPQTREELESLPGVGRKTANVVLNTAFGQPAIGVDTHVFRVANRTGLVEASNVLQTELQLEQRVPKEFKPHAHHWLLLHGRYVCVARKPKCPECLIRDLCEYPEKTA